MTGVPLSEIPGCVIENPPTGYHPEYRLGWCQGVEEQSSTRLTLSRERLAKIIYNDMREGFFKTIHHINDYPEWDKADERWRTTAYRQADAIIQSLPELLEVQK